MPCAALGLLALPSMPLLVPLMVALLLVSGMGVALLGCIKVPLARRLEMDEARTGGLVSVFGFTLIPVILAAGFLTDLVGRQLVLTGGSLLFAVSLVLLAQARAYPIALAAVTLLSAAWALLVNVGNVLTPQTFGGSLAYATNLANVFFGLGALLSPLGVTFLVRRTSFSLALTFLGVLALAPAGLALELDFTALTPDSPSVGDTNVKLVKPQALAAGQRPSLAGSRARQEGNIGPLLADPVLWLCGFALFFYGPLEASVSGWTTTYLGEKGLREGTASGLLSAFWLAILGSRLLTAFTLPHGWESWFILVLAWACVGVLTGIVVGRSPAIAAAMVLGAGLTFGPIFPTIMAILLGHFPARLHGRAVGLLFAIGGVGWTAIPILIGAYARRTSVQRGFGIAVAAAIGMTGVALALAVWLR